MNIALILSGGTGRRAGTDIPKQYVEVCGKPVLSYSIETLSAHGGIDAIQIVAAPQWHERIRGWLGTADIGMKFRGFSLPGETRQLSVLQGLEDIRKYAGGWQQGRQEGHAAPEQGGGLWGAGPGGLPAGALL